MLLQAGASPNCTDGVAPALYWSTWFTQIPMIELLLRYGADVNAVDDEGWTALYACAWKQRVEAAKILLAAGVNPNLADVEGRTPIFTAVEWENEELLELLVKVSDLNLTDNKGETALHQLGKARSDSHLCADKFMTMLIDHGADVEVKNENLITLAIYTAWYCNIDCVRVMIKAGCNLNVQNHEDETPLNMISRMNKDNPNYDTNRAVVCAMLIEAGADVDLPNIHGASPITNLVEYPNFSMIRQLLHANCIGTVTHIISEDAVKEFMAAAISNKAQDCATFMFGDSCSPEDQEVFYNLSLQPEAMVNGETIGLSEPPPSLRSLCRLTVRSLLPKGPAFLTAVDQLEIPRSLKDFVAIRC